MNYNVNFKKKKDFLHIYWLLKTKYLCLLHTPPKKWNVEVKSPNVIVFGGCALGRELGHEGGAFINGISALRC